MTLAADRGLDWTIPDDRRATAAGPRRSWASPQPFEMRRTQFNDALARAQAWAKVAVTYRWRSLATDALGASSVSYGLLAAQEVAPGVNAALTVIGTLGFLLLVLVTRGYDPKELGDGSAEYQSVLRAGVAAAVILMGIGYATTMEVPRSIVFLGVPAAVLVSMSARHLHRQSLHRARAQGEAMMRTLVVGERADVARVVSDLSAAPYHGYQVTGACLPSLEGSDELTVPVVGAVADVPQIVADHAVDVVVVAGACLSGEALRRLSWALDRAGAQLTVAPDLVEVTAPRLSLRPTAGLSLLRVEVGAPRNRMVAKAALDKVLGIVFLACAAPVIAAATLAVWATDRGPAFFRQTRVGVDGRHFTMWKLRSMYVDADARRAELLGSNEADGVLFKMRHDPRVTPVGRLLRRFSLDELPQLLNVVKGDMSLVGPRPPLAEEVAMYPDEAYRRLRVRPGLTGLWQVSGRSDLSWDDSVRLDLRYVDNWSLAMDLTILWKTGRAVVLGAGAY